MNPTPNKSINFTPSAPEAAELLRLLRRYIPMKGLSKLKVLKILIIWSLLMSEAISDNLYFTAQGEQDGKPVIYRSLERVPENQKESDYPNLINIYWPYDVDANNGMPDPTTNDNQITFEDAIESLDQSGISHLMLVVTGNGRKEWIWYVKDVESWMNQLNEKLAGHDVYPIEIEIDQDPEWSTYHNFVAGVKGI